MNVLAVENGNKLKEISFVLTKLFMVPIDRIEFCFYNNMFIWCIMCTKPARHRNLGQQHRWFSMIHFHIHKPNIHLKNMRIEEVCFQLAKTVRVLI